MVTSTRRGISYPNPDRSDRPDVPLHLKYLVDALDVDVIFTQGTDAARGSAAHQTGGGKFWWTTDTLVLWYDDGTTWRQVVAVGGGAGGSLPLGAVFDWPWDASQLPSQCVLAYGQAISRSTYATLNSVAAVGGYPHGAGNGTTTFNLPDYRGRVGAGKDDMGGTAANRVTGAGSSITGTQLGASGGSQVVTLSTSQMPVHNHTTSGLSLPDHSHSASFTAYESGSGGESVPHQPGGGATSVQAVTVGNPTSHPSISGTIDNQGGGGSHNNMPPCVIVNKAMRVL